MNKARIRLFAVLLTAVSILLSCKQEEQPVDVPPDNIKSLRAYTEEVDNASIRMPESTVYIQGEVADDLESLDPNWNSITFKGSDALKYQNIKEGDILYSAERTKIAPNGYCLRVLSVSESGGSVTYRTEPASALEAIDFLDETGVMTAGNYEPDDVKVYMLPVDENNVPTTRGSLDNNEGIEIKAGKLEFKSDSKDTSFGVIIYEDKEHSANTSESFKVKLTVNLHHEVDDEKTNLHVEQGNVIFYSQMNVGVGIKLEVGTKMSLESNTTSDSIVDKLIEDKAKAALVGKRFKLFEVPLNWTASNIIFSPKLVFYGEFKLDFSGKLVVETGIQDGIYALNIANNGPWSVDFSTLTYFKRISHFYPYFKMSASLEFKAVAGLGAGFVLEFPCIPVTDKTGNTVSSYAGMFVGLEMSQSIDVKFEKTAFSGETKVTASGSDGVCSVVEDIDILIGLKKALKAETSWRITDIPLFEIPGWEWPIYVSTPAPFDLVSEVQGSYAKLSWTHPNNLSAFTDTRVYIDYSVAGDAANAYKTNYTETELIYGPAVDGLYRWRVENKALDGGIYSSPTESFEINNSAITTGQPVWEDDHFVVPVALVTLNEVRSKGVVYSSEYQEPSADTEDCVVYEGEGNDFTVSLDKLSSGVTYYARSYAYINKNGGWFVIYGDVVTLSIEPPKIVIEPVSLDFGNVVVGQSADRSLSIANDGGRDLLIASITCADGFSTDFKEGGQVVLKPGESKEFTVTFAPTEDRPYAGTMIVNSNASGNHTAVVKLSGNAVRPSAPVISVTPESLVFDPVQEGGSGESQISITNTGNAVLNISSVEFSEAGSPFSVIGPVPQAVEEGESCSIAVRFSPDSPGMYSTTLIIKSDSAYTPELAVPVSGECTQLPYPVISVASALDFGETTLGVSVTRSLTVGNVGNADLTIKRVDCPGGFKLSEQLTDRVIVPGGSIELQIAFSASLTGSFSETLVVVSDDPNNPESAVSLSAVCNMPPVPPGNIVFEDSRVKSICVSNWDTNGDGELSYAEAAAVTSLGRVFVDSAISVFNEFKHFIGLTTIDEWSFSGTKSLKSISVPPTVKYIGIGAFGESALSAVQIPEGVERIGNLAFWECPNLKTVSFPSTVTRIEYQSFADSGLEYVTIPGTLKYIGEMSFMNCKKLKTVTIMEGVETIDMNAFDSSALESVVIPAGVKKINDYAFNYCLNLRSVVINEGPLALGTGAFGYCSSLVSVSIPSSLMSIRGRAFFKCSSLQTIDLPEVSYIADDAFFQCAKLQTVYLRYREAVVTVRDYSFPWSNSGLLIYVPRDLLDSYNEASVWSGHSDLLRALSD